MDRPEELWVVFDKAPRPQSERARPSTVHISELVTYGKRFKSWQCRQLLLDDTRKRSLVRKLGPGPFDRNDRRLRYRRIGDIFSGAKDDTSERELHEQLRDANDDATVRAFSFLAIAAGVPSPAVLRPADIAAILPVADRDRESDQERGRNRARKRNRGRRRDSGRGQGRSREQDPLRDLLLEWFPENDRRGPLVAAFRNARDLEPLFDEPAKGERDRMRVDVGFADAFAHGYQSFRRDHHLPPADCAHAFWALYWQRQLATDSGSWSAPTVERLVSHLRALREPESVSYLYGEQVARALCEAALFGANAALALCVPGITPRQVTGDATDADDRNGLIDCALMLLTEAGTPQDGELLESLLDTAWALYMLRGGSALLQSISAIADRCQIDRRQTAGSQAGEPRVDELPDEPQTGRLQMDESQVDGARVDGSTIFESQIDVARFDGSRIEPAESGDPLLGLYLQSLSTDDAGKPPLPDRSAAGAQAVRDHARVRALWLMEVLEPLLHRGESAWLSHRAADSDVAMVEIVRRVLARTNTAKSDMFNSLDYATLVLAGLWCTLRQTRGGRLSDALTEPFREVGVAIGQAREARQSSGVRNDFVFKGLLEMLSVIVRAAGTDLATLREELTALHMMWYSLELYELADLSGLGCNVYAAADPRTRFDDGAKCLIGLGGAADRPINVVESEMLAGISRLYESITSGAVPIVEAGCLATQRGLGEGLAFELARLLVTQPLETGDGKGEQLLAVALDVPAGHRDVLEIPDSNLDSRVTQLFNNVAKPEGAVAQRLMSAIAERRRRIRSPWHDDQLDQEYEYWYVGHFGAPAEDDALRELLTRWRTRIWEPGLPVSLAAAEAAPAERAAVAETAQWGGEGITEGAGEHSCMCAENALHVGNASSSRDADITYVYEFPEDGRRSLTGSTQPSDYRLRACYAYAFVLARIWKAVDRLEGAILHDAIRLLNQNLDFNRGGYVILASLASARMAETGDTSSVAFKQAIEIQRDGIGRAQREILPATNYAVYSQLADHDPDPASSSSHRRHAELWLYEDERIAQETLFLEIEGRHYFEIFWYHYKRLHEPPCDLERKEVETPCSSLQGERPQPLVFDSTGRAVCMSGSFLRLGYEVFRRRPDAPGSDAIREQISSSARRNVHALYDLLMQRDGISEPLHRLYEEQLKRFDEIEG